LYRGQPQTRKAWLDDACHRLRHEVGGAEWVLKRLRSLARERPWAKDDENVQRAITYFSNQSGAGRMDYAARVAADEPIGSGVTKAACKVIVKQPPPARAGDHVGRLGQHAGSPQRIGHRGRRGHPGQPRVRPGRDDPCELIHLMIVLQRKKDLVHPGEARAAFSLR
jgi:hypothetical protein